MPWPVFWPHYKADGNWSLLLSSLSVLLRIVFDVLDSGLTDGTVEALAESKTGELSLFCLFLSIKLISFQD